MQKLGISQKAQQWALVVQTHGTPYENVSEVEHFMGEGTQAKTVSDGLTINEHGVKFLIMAHFLQASVRSSSGL